MPRPAQGQQPKQDKGRRIEVEGGRPSFKQGSKPYSRSPSTSTSTRPSQPFQSSRPSTDPKRNPTSSRPSMVDPKPEKPASTSLTLTEQDLSTPPDLSTNSRITKLELTQCTSLSSLDFLRSARHTLTNLNMSGTGLPDSASAWEAIRELSTLFVLNASNCSLKRVPSVIESLVSLKALVLSHNEITTLQHVRKLPLLNTLVVSYNSLTSLPSEDLSSLSQLKKLSASHNLLRSTSLPDLSTLSHLRELRLSNNPHLSSLPEHFISWGQSPDPSKKKQGLEVVDLGNCAFVDWFDLKELSKHPIQNLSLKGNDVVDEVQEGGLDEYRSKLTTLFPHLRILDNVRFDPKFVELKAKRAERTPEQKVVDAGPMGLMINARKDEPVEIPSEMLEKIEREREIKRRRKGLERKRKLEGKTPGVAEPVDGTDATEKGEGDRAGTAEGAAAEEPKIELVEAMPLKRKRGRDAKRLGLKKRSDDDSKADLHKEPSAAEVPSASEGRGTEQLETKRKKKKDRHAASSGGLLDALRGTDEERLAEEMKRKQAKEAEENAKKEQSKEADAETSKKQKSSVLKVIDVKKGGKKQDRGQEGAKKVDVVDLLGLAEEPAKEIFGSGWD